VEIGHVQVSEKANVQFCCDRNKAFSRKNELPNVFGGKVEMSRFQQEVNSPVCFNDPQTSVVVEMGQIRIAQNQVAGHVCFGGHGHVMSCPVSLKKKNICSVSKKQNKIHVRFRGKTKPALGS